MTSVPTAPDRDAATFGVRSSVAPLRRVAMRRPGAILGADAERWHYVSPIDAEALIAEYEAFAAAVTASGASIEWLADDADDDLADSVFTYDPSFMIGSGAVVLRPGKPLRLEEADLHASFYRSAGIPIVGRIDAPGTFEGGDCFWLDDTTLAVGRGFRTNRSGIEQFTDIVADHGITVEVYDLPFHLGPESCLHLMSVVSVLDTDLALVHEPLLPTALWERMRELGYELITAPPTEFDASLGLNLNVLATAPRQVIAVGGFPETVALMRSAGCEVTVIDGHALCIPCEGGPTCLTRPLHRA